MRFAPPCVSMVVLSLAACDGGSEKAPTSAPAPPEVRADPTIPAGVIRGVALFEGEAPPRRPIPTAGAPGCEGHGPLLSESAIVTDGRLANVFVVAKSGFDEASVPPPPSEPALLDQKGCAYVPHVLAVRVGQPLLVRNADPTSHNVNAKPKRPQNDGASFNSTQAPGSPEIEVRFDASETQVPFGCDIHPWMRAWVHAVSHPWHAISAADGSFEITGLAPGRYRFEAVHEWLGTRAFEVELPPEHGAHVTLTWRASDARD